MEIHVGGDGSLITLADLNSYPQFCGRRLGSEFKVTRASIR